MVLNTAEQIIIGIILGVGVILILIATAFLIHYLTRDPGY